MNLPPLTIVAIVASAAAYCVAIYAGGRVSQGSSRVLFRYAALVATVVSFFLACRLCVDDHPRTTDLTKAMIAVSAAGALFYEQHRAAQRRPLAERWKRAVGVTLGVAVIVVNSNGFKLQNPK